MTVTIHFDDQRKPKTYLTARSVIHTPRGYMITWADFSRKDPLDNPTLEKDTYKKHEIKYMQIH